MTDLKNHWLVKLYVLYIKAAKFLPQVLLLAMRVIWGWQFFEAGKGKLGNLGGTAEFFAKLHIPLPHLNAFMAASTECFGGMLLLLGLGGRLVALPLTITMVVAYLTTELPVERFTQLLNATPFMFLVTSVIVLCFGPGKLSIDYLISRFVIKNKPG